MIDSGRKPRHVHSSGKGAEKLSSTTHRQPKGDECYRLFNRVVHTFFSFVSIVFVFVVVRAALLPPKSSKESRLRRLVVVSSSRTIRTAKSDTHHDEHEILSTSVREHASRSAFGEMNAFMEMNPRDACGIFQRFAEFFGQTRRALAHTQISTKARHPPHTGGALQEGGETTCAWPRIAPMSGAP